MKSSLPILFGLRFLIHGSLDFKPKSNCFNRSSLRIENLLECIIRMYNSASKLIPMSLRPYLIAT